MAKLDPKTAAPERKAPARRDKAFLKRENAKASKRLSEEYSTLSVYILRDTHRRFKSRAGLEGIDMSEVADKLLQKWIDKQVKL